MFRKGHPLDKGKFTLKDFSAAEHVVVVAAGTGHGKVDDLMEHAGVRRNVRLRVPHYVAWAISCREPRVVTVPERLAQRSTAPFGLKYVPHPVKLPEIVINLFWHARHHREPGNQWLRHLIFDTFVE